MNKNPKNSSRKEISNQIKVDEVLSDSDHEELNYDHLNKLNEIVTDRDHSDLRKSKIFKNAVSNLKGQDQQAL